MEINSVNKTNEEIEIDLKQIFFVVFDKLLLIIVVTILAGCITFMYSKFIVRPVYNSTTQIYVMSKSDDNKTTYTDLQTSNILTKDYQVIILSRPVMENVIADLDLDMSIEELQAMISVEIVTDTRLINIDVESTDPWLARNIADCVKEISKEQIQKIMNIESVNTVEEANLPLNPVSPRVLRNVMIGSIIGFVFVVGFIIIRFLLDDTIKTPEDIEKYLGVSVLSSIPVAESENAIKKKKMRK